MTRVLIVEVIQYYPNIFSNIGFGQVLNTFTFGFGMAKIGWLKFDKHLPLAQRKISVGKYVVK